MPFIHKNTLRRHLALLPSLLLLLYSHAFAASSPEALGSAVIKAIQDSSVKDYYALIHPGCPIAAVNSSYVTHTVNKSVPPNTRAIVEPWEKYSAMAQTVDFPVTPESWVLIRDTEELDGTTTFFLSFPAASKDGKWYAILCMKDKTNN